MGYGPVQQIHQPTLHAIEEAAKRLGLERPCRELSNVFFIAYKMLPRRQNLFLQFYNLPPV